MTIVGLHDFVKVSISASLKSFLLIMWFDVPESTTNSRSSSLRFDGASRHNFSEGEKNVALSCSFNFNTLLASFHAASRAPCSCHSVSSWDRSSNFGVLGLRWWGSLGQIIPSDGFWSRMSAWRAIASVNFTRWIGFCMSELFREVDDNFGDAISWNTQPNCRVHDESKTEGFPSIEKLMLLQHSHCTSATILFRPFCWAVLQLGDAHESTFHGCHFSQNEIGASSFEEILSGQSKHSSGTSGSRRFSFILLHERIWRWIRLCHFCTLVDIVTETTSVSCRALTVGFSLPTISQTSFVHAVCPLILDYGVPFIISVSGFKKYSFVKSSSILLFTTVFNLW